VLADPSPIGIKHGDYKDRSDLYNGIA